MLLAFDTATPLVTVALHDGTDVVAERSSERPMKHGEHLQPMIDAVVREAGITPRDLSGIAVGAGPGPFTGLRVGLVAGRTMAFALNIPVHAVCTLDVLALEAFETGVVSGDFLVATDARRKEVYLASYRDGVRRSGPEVVKPADAAAQVPVVGEGAAIYADHFPNQVGPLMPSAGWLARAVVGQRVELLAPDPLYLRRPDAVVSPKATRSLL